MARKGTRKQAPPSKRQPLPSALPPEERPVGQLVAEALRLYGRRFWPSLALGLPIALLDLALPELSRAGRVLFTLTIGGLLVTISYISGTAIAAGRRPTAASFGVALAVGFLVFLPFPVLLAFLVLPALAWLALFGLAVPAAIVEERGFADALRRGYRLGRADYVHALGSLAALAIVYFLTRLTLYVVLHGANETGERTAAFLADLVLTPILFLGAGLLYFDQAARLESGRPRSRRSRDADIHHALEPHGPGRADAEGEPRPAARGES
jgi:hypothetical protein